MSPQEDVLEKLKELLQGLKNTTGEALTKTLQIINQFCKANPIAKTAMENFTQGYSPNSHLTQDQQHMQLGFVGFIAKTLGIKEPSSSYAFNPLNPTERKALIKNPDVVGLIMNSLNEHVDDQKRLNNTLSNPFRLSPKPPGAI